MTSQIDVSNIDALYPVAGQDNDTQGFRDNFSNIKTALSRANVEITDLQTRSVVVADENNDPVTNNLLGSAIVNGFYSQLAGVTYNPASVPSSIDISLNNGPLQIFTLSANTTLRFTDWPASGFGAVRVHFRSNGSGVWTPTLATENGGVLQYQSNFPSLAVPVTQTHKAIEAWTFNGGATVFVRYLGSLDNDNSVISSFASMAITNTTDATNTGNGVLTVAGGVGIAKSAFVGLGLTVGGTTNLVGTLVSQNNTNATSPTTASATFAGGVGIAKDLYVGEDVVVTGNLTVNGSLIATSITDIGQIDNVSITDPRNGDLLTYDSNLSVWTNNGNLVEYAVTIDDNGSGTQEVFFLDGIPLVTNTGVKLGLTFKVGKKYRFDLSNVSNLGGPLRFSTTPDTAVPASITPYTNNVTINGTAGSAGAYIEIIITEDTPKILYLYGDESGTMIDTSLLGAAYPIQVGSNYYTGSEDLVDGAAASLGKTVSYFTTSAPETATLAAGEDGQIKTFAMVGDTGDMVITVTNPAWGGAGTITFNSVGQACTLQYISNKWFCVGNNGAVFG